MLLLDSVLALLAVLAMCVFFATRRGVAASLAPLLSLSVVMVWLSLGGVLGVLVPAGWVLYLGSLALFCYVLFVEKQKDWWKQVFQPGVLFFTAASLFALVLLAYRQPVFSQWDEFVFWGVAPKLLKLNGSLYTTAETGWFWTSTEKPGLIMLGYFAQFFGKAFAPWKVYLGYDMLMFACGAAMLAPLERRDWSVAVPLCAAALVIPFYFGAPDRTTHASKVYVSAYGDLPAGILFGGVLALYFVLRSQKDAPVWPAMLPLTAFVLTKDNVFPIVLVAAGMMALDTIFFVHGENRKALLKKVGSVAAMVLVPLGTYLAWGFHASWANAQNPMTMGESTNISPYAAVGMALQELAGVKPQNESLQEIVSSLRTAYFSREGFTASMLGIGLFTTGLILFVFLLAAVFADTKHQRKRVVVSGVLSTLGFIGYHFVLMVTYVYISKGDGGIPDYDRYISTYYIGWFMMALALLVVSVKQRLSEPVLPAGADITKTVKDNWGMAYISRCCLLGLCCLLAVSFAVTVLPGYSVLDAPADVYKEDRLIQQQAEGLASQLPAGSRTFFVSQGDDGYYWFRYSYHFLPRVLDYSGGGVTIASPGLPEEETGDYWELTLDEMRQYLKENDCEYMVIQNLDDVFADTYGDLFTDKLKAAGQQEPVLYQRTGQGRYQPVPQ